MNKPISSPNMPYTMTSIANHEENNPSGEVLDSYLLLSETSSREQSLPDTAGIHSPNTFKSMEHDITGWPGLSRPLSMPSMPSDLQPDLLQHNPRGPQLNNEHHGWYNNWQRTSTSAPRIGCYCDNPLRNPKETGHDVPWSTSSATYERGLSTVSGAEEQREDHQPRLLVCKWEGCTYTRGFNREMDLVRHVRSLHISPGSYRCCVRRCPKTFNRRDKLKEHLDKAHSDQP